MTSGPGVPVGDLARIPQHFGGHEGEKQVTNGPNRSVPHQRTRRDHASETAEDYVEAIAEIISRRGSCRVTDLAQQFAVSHVTVNRIIDRLKREGLVHTEPYRPIELTESGRQLAQECRQRHEIVYNFLLAIGVDEETAAIDAEGIEHHVSAETLKRFQEVANQAGQALPKTFERHR